MTVKHEVRLVAGVPQYRYQVLMPNGKAVKTAPYVVIKPDMDIEIVRAGKLVAAHPKMVVTWEGLV